MLEAAHLAPEAALLTPELAQLPISYCRHVRPSAGSHGGAWRKIFNFFLPNFGLSVVLAATSAKTNSIAVALDAKTHIKKSTCPRNRPNRPKIHLRAPDYLRAPEYETTCPRVHHPTTFFSNVFKKFFTGIARILAEFSTPFCFVFFQPASCVWGGFSPGYFATRLIALLARGLCPRSTGSHTQLFVNSNAAF